LKPQAAVIFLCLLLAGVASQSVGAESNASASEVTKVRAVLAQEVGLFNRKRWQPMWGMYSPRVRSHCSYSRYVVAMRSVRNASGPVTLRNVTARVTGRRGFVLYQIVANGRVVGGATAKNRDVYTRIGGRWFDDFDADGLCPSGDRPS
jgi:hypothetical protein